ncbi:hypothetical protein QQF64_000318 [Cirrhinus molitorella]|uniref:Uncharacterized protein n=1 Tax=Cirrhinus molitorella TaxID=172907 RepID=A0ABR3NYE7_9TELE
MRGLKSIYCLRVTILVGKTTILCVTTLTFSNQEELTETWKAAVEKYKPTDPTVSLNAEDFSVYVVDLDHGMKDKNPIEYVYFYSKRKPNEASAIKDYQLSSFLPKKFNEELVRVYYKRTYVNKEEEKKKVEEAEKCFQIWCDSKFGLH